MGAVRLKDVDEAQAVIDPRDTRTVVGLALSASHTRAVEGAKGYGVWRM